MRIASLIALLSALPAFAQSPVVRTEIYNGLSRTVSYSAKGLSASDSLSLREAERLENEGNFVRSLGNLKRQYLATERSLEPQRRNAQFAAYSPVPNNGYMSYGFGGLGYPYGYGPRAAFGYGGFGGYGGYGYVSPAYGYSSSPRSAYAMGSYGAGVGPGVIKASLAQAIAAQSSPEYAASLESASERLQARAAASPKLRAALDIQSGRKGRPSTGIRPAGADEAPVVLTLKNGDKVRGAKMQEKGIWIIVTLPGKRTLRLRESEVVRIESTPGAVVPAAGE